MSYDFTTLRDRFSMSSGKWLGMRRANPDVPAGVAPFSTADMDLVPPPQLSEGLKELVGSAIFGYTRPWQGYYDAVTGWMKRRHNWDVQAEWIVTTPGIVTALYDAVKAYAKPGEGVILLTPVYGPFYGAAKANGCVVVESALIPTADSYEIDFADFEEKAKDPNNTMLIFCSPHNPIGRVWRREELEKVADICLRNGLTVVCDEIHHDLIMPGYEHTVFATLSPEIADVTVTCTAASKTFNIAALQTSAIIISNPELRAAFSKAMGGHGTHGANMIGYRGTEIAYTQCEDWLEELLVLIKSNYDYVCSYCAENIPEIKVTRMEGTYLPWLDMRAFGLEEKELEQQLNQKACIFGNMGSAFGEKGTGFLRLTLTCPHWVIVDAMDRLGKWAESIRK